MSTQESHGNESIEGRTERALTESMVVHPEGGEIFTVVGENGNGEYRVDAREGRCTCPDHKHRGVRCKHLRRVAFATGEVPVPEGVDPLLGEHVDGPARPVATDGGVASTPAAADAPTTATTDDHDEHVIVL